MSTAEPEIREKVAAFWAPRDLRDQVAAVLDAAGRDATNTTTEELTDFDQYHVLGAEATLRLAQEAGLGASDHVLDVGSGLGGPARMLAETFGCRVTGIDLTPAYLETAALLNEITGLADLVSFQQGDATKLPFADESFDVVWTQHAAQSIPEKDAFFDEMARVLRPGGRLVIHDLFRAGDVSCTYPACWDRDGSITFIASADDMRGHIERTGLVVDIWRDATADARAWTSHVVELMSTPPDPDAPGPPIPGLDFSLFFGFEDTRQMMINAVADIDSGAIGFFETVARKP